MQSVAFLVAVCLLWQPFFVTSQSVDVLPNFGRGFIAPSTTSFTFNISRSFLCPGGWNTTPTFGAPISFSLSGPIDCANFGQARNCTSESVNFSTNATQSSIWTVVRCIFYFSRLYCDNFHSRLQKGAFPSISHRIFNIPVLSTLQPQS
jgi:hypothetical protein